MSALVFRLKQVPDQRIDLSCLVPEALQGRTEKAIARLPVNTARERLEVGDVFSLRMGDPMSLRFEGGSERFDFLGAGMTTGDILVDGPVGQQAGRLMRGGRLHILGDAGAYAGSRLAGGHLEIDGDAGDRLCGPLAGEMAGMSGGVVIVRGDAGARAADRLRRGLVVIEGRSGKDAGSRMIAGTLLLRGDGDGSTRAAHAAGHDRAARRPLPALADISRLRVAPIGRRGAARCRARAYRAHLRAQAQAALSTPRR